MPRARARSSNRSYESAGLSLTNHILALGILGDAYDKLGRYGEAFAAFTEANALQHEQGASEHCARTWAAHAGQRGPAVNVRGRRGSFHVASRTADEIHACLSCWISAFRNDVARSNTGVSLEVRTLEERDTLLDAANELMADGQFRTLGNTARCRDRGIARTLLAEGEGVRRPGRTDPGIHR